MPKRKYTAGIKCLQCGGYAMAVRWTDPAQGHVLRHRRCQTPGCSGEVVTVERPVGDSLSSLSESIGKLLHSQFDEIIETINKRN